ncbi:unnamed protein product [Prunus armeniaca]|uniref:R13L1/DRL21-like LRR repeat region domain-containing protein n=1 Tax=Prunus armeniaca TaxID=36596 RepID=A0A6J5WI66_PRUAR|nr:unnamed protein product [Prunus armeniaca]
MSEAYHYSICIGSQYRFPEAKSQFSHSVWPKLELLTTYECWSILKHAACSDGSSDIPLGLERIGWEIDKNCEGLPLMAKPILSLDNLKCVGEEIYGNDVFPSLKELCIRNCKELIEWMEAPKQVMVFPCLEKLDIENCPKLRKVPSHFPSMKNLMIEGNEELTCVPEGMLLKIEGMEIMDCEKLTCIAPDVFGCCASIRNLVVKKCPSLQSIPDLHNFTSLRELSIGNCKRLESLVNNGLVSVVELLRIRDCNGLQSIPVLNLFTSLHKLSIKNCERLESLVSSGSVSVVDLNIIKCSGLQSIPALNIFTSLRELSIEYCRRLESLLKIRDAPNLESLQSLDNFTSLSELVIVNCGKLKYLPSLISTSLKRLELGALWEELDFFPDLHLRTGTGSSQLQTLWLKGWPKLKSLPQQIQHFTSLTYLEIRDFDGVEAFPEWLGNLTSLTTLGIYLCKKLMYLPSVRAMQRLTELQTLTVWGCPLLQQFLLS